MFYIIGVIGLFIFGWRTHGKMPNLKKYILIAAPHTTNWDFIFFLLIIFKFQIPVHWMGKHTMFIRPFRHLLIRLGGIPIDRSQKSNTVQIMADEFKQADRLIVTIAPSGTRSGEYQNVTEWKSGFYRIAHQAGVPIVCGFVDYQKKMGGIGPVVEPTGDMEEDMARMKAFYADKAGKYDR